MKHQKLIRLLEWAPSILILLFAPFISWAQWAVHVDMAKSTIRFSMLKKATYLEVKQRMLSHEWENDSDYPKSIFSKNDYNTYLHASIFKFRGISYSLTPYGYFMASLLQRKIRKTIVGVGNK